LFLVSYNIKADKEDDSVYGTLQITHANYGDFDDDEVEEDVIIVKLKLDVEGHAKSYRYSMIYNLWDQAFDSKNKRWIMNDDFMVNNIISKL